MSIGQGMVLSVAYDRQIFHDLTQKMRGFLNFLILFFLTTPFSQGSFYQHSSRQEVLQKYCGNYTEEMGFSCMLSVDPEAMVFPYPD